MFSLASRSHSRQARDYCHPVSILWGCRRCPKTYQVAQGKCLSSTDWDLSFRIWKQNYYSSPGNVCTMYISEHVPPQTTPTDTPEITEALCTVALHWDKMLIPCSPKTLSGNGWKTFQLSDKTYYFYSQWREISIATVSFIWVISEIYLEIRWIVPKKSLFLQSDKKEKLDYLRCKYLSFRDIKFCMINMTFTV